MPEYDEVSIFGGIEDRAELEEMIQNEKSIQYKHIEMLTEAAWGYGVISGLINLLPLIYEWLSKKKRRNISIVINRRDGTSLRVESKNAEDLKVYINEISAQEKTAR